MSPIDLVSLWLDTPERPLDFTTIHRFRPAPPDAAFALGLDSARHRFPVSGSRVGPDGRSWIWLDRAPPDAFQAVTVPRGDEGEVTARGMVQALVDAPFDLTRQAPVRQLIIRRDAGQDAGHEVTVVTRFHHAACDGASASLWLAHQWKVAFGDDVPLRTPAAARPPRLRRHPAPVRRGASAPRGPTPRLVVEDAPPTRTRHWRTFAFPLEHGWPARASRPMEDLPDAVGAGAAAGSAMAAAFLDVLMTWDTARRGRPAVLGLWLPVNIRTPAGRDDFGNGTSRIRVHACWEKDAPWSAKLREVRRQIAWSLRHGEWALPAVPGLMRWPIAITRPLLRAYLNRPWVDMASAAFTYIPANVLSERDAPWVASLQGIETVGLLHARHPVSLIVSDSAAQRVCTFTYDPALLSGADIDEMGRTFLRRVAA